MEINKLRRNAILLDCGCIVVAMVVLFLANRQLLPFAGLLAGALIAAAMMCGSIWCLMRARKLMRNNMAEIEHDASSNTEQ